MNDPFGYYDLDSYSGNGYQASSMVQQSRQQQHQQQQQQQNRRQNQQQHQSHQYNNTPTMENYDPTRINEMNIGTYNPSTSIHAAGTQQLSSTHRTMMPAATLAAGATSVSNGLQQHQQLRGVADFDPLPLSTAALQQIAQSPQTTTMNGLRSPDIGINNMGLMMPRNRIAVASSVGGQNATCHSSRQSQQKTQPAPEPWLEDLSLSVSGLSLEPMTGTAVLDRVDTRTRQVLTRYLPCVDFLVQCQQELRKGLAAATTKRLVHHMFRNAMTPRQFYNTYIATLPERFYRKNKRTMDTEDLNKAVKELQTLCANARAAERQGCEIVKNTFLGGMKDGESWGLRKWLSKHGGALHICNDCEMILSSCQKLDRSQNSTKKLSDRLRPLAKKALGKLKADVPASYQEHSTAHPYLPFFHRLEAALKGMSSFDPEDDDVICIDDDDEVEVLKAKPPPPRREKKRKAQAGNQDAASTNSSKRTAASTSDDDSVVEILDTINKSVRDSADVDVNDDSKYMQELLKTFDDDGAGIELFGDGSPDFDSIAIGGTGQKDSSELASSLDRLVFLFDNNQGESIRPVSVAPGSFWDTSRIYASALRIFIEILQSPDAESFVDRIDEQDLLDLGNPPYSQCIKHPLCFRDIVSSLVEESDDLSSNSGQLPGQGLDSWNMWRGNDLLQAIDLVLLNSLAFSKVAVDGNSSDRTTPNRLRKTLWSGIQQVIDSSYPTANADEKRRIKPTRRGETSGFVVLKR